MKYGTEISCCPLCGGNIIVSDHWQFSYDRVVLKSGKLSKRTKRSNSGPMEVMTAACENVFDGTCSANWDADDFNLSEEEKFMDYKYSEQGESK